MISQMGPLLQLQGVWVGQGTGGFPTMDPFEFYDQMSFGVLKDAYEREGLIRFEEMAWVIESEERVFKHWETGLIRPLSDDLIELQVTHNTGRMESLQGRIEQIGKPRDFKICFESTFLKNAEGLVEATSSQRVWTFQDHHLICTQAMSTKDVEDVSPHLEVKLTRK